jgi:hypothetical protein
MKILIEVDVPDEDGNVDPNHEMGITSEAYDRLTSYTEHGPGALEWLGEVQDVRKVA